MFSRLGLMIGDDIKKLQNSNVIVFGLGGVGGYVAEMLVRSGVGKITIVDYDVVDISNKNRQIIALESTIGKKKVEVLKERILDINPDVIVNIYDMKVDEDNINDFNFKDFTYVADCVDDVIAKMAIISKCKEENVKIISSMGTGNKLDPSKFLIKDISKTTVCPLAKKIRLECRRKDIKDVKVLYSLEEPIKNSDFIASVSFVPSVAGILIGREIIFDIING